MVLQQLSSVIQQASYNVFETEYKAFVIISDQLFQKPTSGSQWTPTHSRMSDWPQKQASAKADLLTFGNGVMTIS